MSATKKWDPQDELIRGLPSDADACRVVCVHCGREPYEHLDDGGCYDVPDVFEIELEDL